MFDEAEQREMIYLELRHLLVCPCCGSRDTALVDVAFEAATGREVKVGNTRQCNACYAYFAPGESCSENFTP